MFDVVLVVADGFIWEYPNGNDRKDEKSYYHAENCHSIGFKSPN
jgi:hypothetical protein